MAHPKDTKRIKGTLWHLEDKNLTQSDAHAIARHLRHTEDKRAIISKTKNGFQVWWARR